jgi:hypothetical protein
MYDLYKIVRVDCLISPAYDPGQSGVTNNSIIQLYLACDPAGHYTTPTTLQVGAFGNHRTFDLVAGKTYRYSCKPKPVNSLASGSFATSSDWLLCTTAGAAVPHLRLLIAATTFNAADVQAINIIYRYHILVKGAY